MQRAAADLPVHRFRLRRSLRGTGQSGAARAGARIAASSTSSTTRPASTSRRRASARRARAAPAGGVGDPRRGRSGRRQHARRGGRSKPTAGGSSGPTMDSCRSSRRAAQRRRCYALEWLPAPASVSFHGRDLFAPAAAAIARGAVGVGSGCEGAARRRARCGRSRRHRLHRSLRQCDDGHRARRRVDPDAGCACRRTPSRHARVFSDVQPGELFWYENSIGLVEIAANRASAAACSVCVGQSVRFGTASCSPGRCTDWRATPDAIYTIGHGNRPLEEFIVAAPERGHRVSRRRAGFSRIAPPSALRPRGARALAARRGHRIRMGRRGARRTPPRPRRFAARRDAQRELSRLRRSHGNRRFPAQVSSGCSSAPPASASRSCAPSACHGSAIAT